MLSELAPMGPVGPVTLNEVLVIARALALASCRPASFPTLREKVFVATIDAAQGMSFDAVFVPGLAEKMFPRKIVEEPILLDAVREQIGDLAVNPTRLQEERLALALAS